MPRYKLTIEYDGAPFRGWQVQESDLTVQGVLEQAAKALSGEDVRVHGAGRTDAGVHAKGQVAHRRSREGVPHRPGARRDERAFAAASGRRAERRTVADDFEARFSAIKRHYLYRIVNRRADLALDLGHAWRVPRPLDVDADAPRRAAAARQARFHHLPRRRMPGEIAGEDAGSARRRARRART